MTIENCKKKKWLKKLLKSCKKVGNKLAKSWQKVVQSCQKVGKKLSKVVKKLSKSCQKVGKKFVVPRPGATLSHLVKRINNISHNFI
jgi:DNA anti-recombination protein RmuC